MTMATKSVLKDVDIRDKDMGRLLVEALENAENKSSKEVIFSKKVNEIDKSQIVDIFGE